MVDFDFEDALEGTVEDTVPAPPPPPAAGLFALAATTPAPSSIVWTEEQQNALSLIDGWTRGTAPFFALVGPAGAGKTVLTREICVRYPNAQLTAMTGKAALRLAECAERPATTLHSKLYYPPRPGEDVRFTRLRDPESSFFIIDESSMMGISVFNDLRAWAERGVRFLLVGDGYQLPPVITGEEARQYGDDWSVFTIVKGAQLTTVMRNSGGVLQAATRVRDTGEICRESIPDDRGGYEYVECSRPAERAIEEYLNDPDEHMMITWRNSTRMSANRAIRERLGFNGPLPDPGEPVLIKKNGQGVMNGEILPAGTFETGPVLGGLRTMWMATSFGKLLISFDGGDRQKGGEFFDGNQWVPDWKKYHTQIKKDVLPQPIPLTFGYCLTAHACVHPDTLVETPDGLFRISEIPQNGAIATPYGVKKYYNRVVNTVARMLRVTTQDGYTLDVTPDHGMFVWDGEQYVRIEACDLKPGLFLQFRLGVLCDPSRKVVLHSAPQDLDIRAVIHPLPKEVDETFAEFLGMLVADGTLFRTGFRLIKRHRDVVLRFKQLAETLFNANVCDENNLQYDDPGVTGVCVNSVQICKWLDEIDGLQSKRKDVPRCILQSPLAIQAKFLRGLFEDGTVNLKKNTDRVDHIEWTTCRETLARTVQIMLLRFGIISARTQRCASRTSYGSDMQYVVYIYGVNARRFGDQIGFISQWKQQRLVEKGSTAKETRYGAPVSVRELDVVRPYLDRRVTYSNAKISGRISRDTMARVVNAARGEARHILAEKSLFHHSRITSIERIDDAPSMCVEVPDGGRFLQNGSPQSNSQGSQARRVTVFLDRGDLRSQHFNKPTTLPTGEQVPFSSRFIYTATTRSKAHTTMIVGN